MYRDNSAGELEYAGKYKSFLGGMLLPSISWKRNSAVLLIPDTDQVGGMNKEKLAVNRKYTTCDLTVTLRNPPIFLPN